MHDRRHADLRSCIGYWKDDKVQTIKVDGFATMPSCVAFTRKGRKFGYKAKTDVRPGNVTFGLSRQCGCPGSESRLAPL